MTTANLKSEAEERLRKRVRRLLDLAGVKLPQELEAAKQAEDRVLSFMREYKEDPATAEEKLHSFLQAPDIESHGARRAADWPVSEQVTLRDETVDVERRPADRPASEADPAALQEGTIEARERHEEPVVEKQARVTGEVGIRKDVEERTETVRDTAQRTDVEDASGQATERGYRETGERGYRETGTAGTEGTTTRRESGLTDRIEDATGLDIDRDEDIAGRARW